MTAQEPIISPLKWAGGKRWLTGRHSDMFPELFERYYEPFLGGASVFLSLQPRKATLADANKELIAMYEAIRDDWQKVVEYLTEHSKRHGKTYYYAQRADVPTGKYKRAAWFLYMNRACYNGLYRVNMRGEFNVPKGTKEDILLRSDDFESISSALQNATLKHADFEKIVDAAKEGDFVYADPPYTVKHNNNGFVKYNEQLFSWGDQERLAAAVKRAARRGVMVAVSNADHSSVIDLYKGWAGITRLNRHSTIGGRLASRAGTTEIFVRVGYE